MSGYRGRGRRGQGVPLRHLFALLLAPVLLLAVVELGQILRWGIFGSDFAGTIYHPARAVLDGGTPYGVPGGPGDLAGSVYPPSAFLPLAWIGWLPFGVAAWLWALLLAVAAWAALRLVGVRDWRCQAFWLLSPMMLATIAIGNATVLVVLFVAALWRWRDRPGRAAAALTAAVAVKMFAAPLILWLLFTRRYRAAVLTAAAAPLVLAGSWALIGFDSLGRYPDILSANTDVFAASGPYLQSLLLQVGYSSGVALAAGAAAATGLAAAAFAWRRDDLRAFALVLLAAILLSPVAWIGYMGLLVIPLAVRWPRWSPAWLLLLATNVHWYEAPWPFRFTTWPLSVATLLLLTAVAAVLLAPGLPGRRYQRSPAVAVAAPRS